MKKLKVADRRRHAAGDHPPVARDRAARRALRPRARAHRPELRLRAEPDLLRGPRRAQAGSLPRQRRRRARRRRSATSSSPSTACSPQSSPDAVLVLGDTNSCLAVIPAKRRKIPIFHMEAGNRCFDQRVPEEINRRIVDHTADVNLTYSSIAREYLLREGLPPDLVIKTGSPMFEVLTHYRPQIDASDVLERLGLRARTILRRQRASRGERRRAADASPSWSTCSTRSPRTTACRSSSRRIRARRSASRATGATLPRQRAAAEAARLPRLRQAAADRRARCCPTAARSARSRRS